jgi:hypothetical protein
MACSLATMRFFAVFRQTVNGAVIWLIKANQVLSGALSTPESLQNDEESRTG